MKGLLADWARAAFRTNSRRVREKQSRPLRSTPKVELLEQRLLLATTSTNYSITIVEDQAGDGVTGEDIASPKWVLFGGEITTDYSYINCTFNHATTSGDSTFLPNGTALTYSTTTSNCSGVDDEGHPFTVENVIYQIVDAPLTEQPPVGEYWVFTDSDCGSSCILDGPVTYSYFHLPSATGVVFHDHDGNGIRDANDEAVPGSSVCIGPAIFSSAACVEQQFFNFRFRASSGELSSDTLAPASVVAGTSGNYTLPAIPRIVMEPPPGYQFALTVQPPPGHVGESVATTGETSFDPDTTSGAVLNRDLGLFYRSDVSGIVYHDHNGNGQQDTGDEPFTGRPVSILPDNNDDGKWSSSEDCSIATPCLFGQTDSVDPDGTYRVTGPGNFGPNVSSDRYTITEGGLGQLALSGVDNPSANFGIFENVQYIFGTVFDDRNGNGVWDAHPNPESGVAGVQVELDLNNDGSVDETAVTDTSGSFQFDNIGPGTHRISQLLNSGIGQSFPQDSRGYIFSLQSGQAPAAFLFGRTDPPFSVAVDDIFPTEGVAFTKQVATISSDEPLSANAYGVTIDWGDGSSSPGSVSPGGTSNGITFFIVRGTHTYKSRGRFEAKVTVSQPGGFTATGTRTFEVDDAPLSSAGFELNAVEGSSLGTRVASFDDQNPFGTESQFSATINWGDGKSSDGNIIPVVGVSNFEVGGTHTYENRGTYTITVQINSVGGTSSTRATSVVTVDDATLTFVELRPDPVIVEGRTENGNEPSILAAYFTDANLFSLADDFAATIEWGDGFVTDDPLISRVEAGRFFIQGKHTYSFAGNYPLQLHVTDGGSSSATVSGTAVVSDAPLESLAADVDAVRGVPFHGRVGSFVDNNPFSTADQFGATVDWGDGFRTSADVVFVAEETEDGQPTNLYDLLAQHTYYDPGEYPIRVTVSGGGVTEVFSGSFVIDLDMFLSGDETITVTEGQEFSQRIATIEDPGSRGVATDYRAEFDWSDGSSSLGDVRFTGFYTNENNVPVATFDVFGTHAFDSPGEGDIEVSVRDSSGRSTSGLVHVIVENAVLNAQGRPVHARSSVPFNGVVATFTDGDLLSTPGDYVATIDWADGSQTEGTVQGSPRGGFSVLGSHTYPAGLQGESEILVQIAEPDGDSIVASSPVVIIDESDPGVTLIPDLEVVQIELVQAIQYGDNNVQLVAGKNTAARVFVYSGDLAPGPIPGVTALLRGYRNGNELAGSPLTPINGTLTVPFNLTPTETDGSFNFLLPAEWIVAGDLRLEAEVDPAGTVNELRNDNNTRDITVSFVPRNTLDIAYIAVCYQPNPNEPKLCPSDAIATHDELLRKVYPVSDRGVSYHPFEVPEMTWPEALDGAGVYDIIARLRAMLDVAEALGSDVPDQLAAWLPSLPDLDVPLGLADPIWANSTGRVTIQQDTSMGPIADSVDAQFTLAHEIAHNLGRFHVNTEDGCGAEDEFTDWPFDTATLGDIGFDTSTGQVVPFDKLDIMSYCSPPGSNIWVSAFTYENLFAGNLQPAGNPGAGSASRSARVAHPPADYLVITGSAQRDGGGQIDSAFRITSSLANPQSDPFGNYCIHFSDDIGFLTKFCFRLNFEDERTGEALGKESFSLIVPLPNGANRAVFKHSTETLDEIVPSLTAPTVTITSPRAGDVWSGKQTIVWSASDNDGDSLSYSVLYSADNGDSWIPLAFGLSEPQFSFDASSLASGPVTLFRVLASDGWHTTAAAAGPVRMPLPNGEISGLIFDDRDADTQHDDGERYLQGWTVFVDANGDGTLNNSSAGDGTCDTTAEELCTRTGVDGSYRFTGLRPGRYSILDILKPGYARSLPQSPGSRSVVLTSNDSVAPSQDFASTSRGDTHGPVIESVRFATIQAGQRQRIRSIIVAANEPLDEASATDRGQYRVFEMSKTGRRGARVTLERAEYDAARQLVQLFPAKPLKTNVFYEVIVQSTLTDLNGNALDGNADDVAGDAFVTQIAAGNRLSYADKNNDTVTLSLAGDGVLQLVRRADGEGQSLSLFGTSPRRSVLSGTVKRPRRGGDGITTLTSLTAATGFRNRLPAPFQIGTTQFAALIDEVLSDAS